eukprot:1927668-Amphidinium_carterae.1
MEDQMNENYESRTSVCCQCDLVVMVTKVDTVLVTYKVPNSEQAYKLSYRIDKQTKAYMLREELH